MLYSVPMCAIHVPLSFTISSVGCILGCTVDLNPVVQMKMYFFTHERLKIRHTQLFSNGRSPREC